MINERQPVTVHQQKLQQPTADQVTSK